MTGGGRQEEEIIRRKGEDGMNYANRYSQHMRRDVFIVSTQEEDTISRWEKGRKLGWREGRGGFIDRGKI